MVQRGIKTFESKAIKERRNTSVGRVCNSDIHLVQQNATLFSKVGCDLLLYRDRQHPFSAVPFVNPNENLGVIVPGKSWSGGLIELIIS